LICSILSHAYPEDKQSAFDQTVRDVSQNNIAGPRTERLTEQDNVNMPMETKVELSWSIRCLSCINQAGTCIACKCLCSPVLLTLACCVGSCSAHSAVSTCTDQNCTHPAFTGFAITGLGNTLQCRCCFFLPILELSSAWAIKAGRFGESDQPRLPNENSALGHY